MPRSFFASSLFVRFFGQEVAAWHGHRPLAVWWSPPLAEASQVTGTGDRRRPAGGKHVRRDAGHQAPDDPTTRLLQERIDGRPLSGEEIVSIIRNWTVGELGTIAASVGIVVHYLATHPNLQAGLRADPAALPAAVDEILRIHVPLIANRRITTRPVEVGGRRIPKGERVTLIWASANRDEAAFGDPDVFDPGQNHSRNLLYGAGIHVCPGAPLARLELRIVVGTLFGRIGRITVADRASPVRAAYPSSGFRSLFLRMSPPRPMRTSEG